MADELLLSVNPTQVSVDPGGVSAVALQLQNRSGVVDEFVIEVLGEAAAWTSVDRPRVPIFPNGVESVQVTIRPPRSSHPAAGTIPIGFRARSTADPSRSVVEECRVDVKPFVEIGGEVVPRTAKGRFFATHKLRVINRGNALASVTVRAEVQQGDCAVSVPEPQVLVAAGERKTTKVRVRPAAAHWQGGDEMHQYRLSLEPKGGTPVVLDAMMRQPPITRMPLALLAAAVLLLGGAYVVYGKGPNPLQSKLQAVWSGAVDVQPSPTASEASPAQSRSPQPAPSPVPQPPPPVTSGPTTQSCVPGAPTNVKASAGNGVATVTWSSPTVACGLAITAYTVNASPGNIVAPAGNSGSSATVTNLNNGTAYTFTVTATNSTGTGPASSPSNAVTPATIPGPPLNVQASAGDTSVSLTWNAPSTDGGLPITSYTVTGVTIAKTVQAASGSATMLTGLRNGTTYWFVVTATNAIGTGPASAASNHVTPVCTAVHSANLGITLSSYTATLAWQSSGTCGPFSGTIDCTFQAVNAQGNPSGSGTVHATFADPTGSTKVTNTSSLNCSMTIRDANGSTSSASAKYP